MSIGIPIKLLHEAVAQVITVETKAGDLYRGILSSAEDNMNVQLRTVSYTRRDGKVSSLEHVFIRGSKIRFIVMPDMLENAPMFERLQALKEGKATARGLGRGRGFTPTIRGKPLLFYFPLRITKPIHHKKCPCLSIFYPITAGYSFMSIVLVDNLSRSRKRTRTR